MRTLLALATLTLLAGCKVAAPAADFRWKVNAPASVLEESRLHFTVETHQNGSPVRGVPYVWRVQWVGVDGIRHQGHSFDAESIRVKGAPGTAMVQILAVDDGGYLVEVARAAFDVKPGHPPAD
jgi:hypothetical protein